MEENLGNMVTCSPNDSINDGLRLMQITTIEGGSSSKEKGKGVIEVVDESPKSGIAEYVEPVSLVGNICGTKDEAYGLYLDHAFRYGFGVRKARSNNRQGTGEKKVQRQQFYFCDHAGFKIVKGDKPRLYTKTDYRCGCKAMVQYDVDFNSGMYVLTQHTRVHNHQMVPVSQRHQIRSHRKVSKEHLITISTLAESGVGVADAFRSLKNEVGGDKNLPFTKRDAYNAMTREKNKSFDVNDARTLIKIFTSRQSKESDFYFDCEFDDDGALISFFWRDGRMKKDYEMFGDLVVHDTTYRTNTYGMICGPFIGMNHHAQNIMFGVGFLYNERSKSFDWLFETFLRSMGGRQPVTFMTDQCTAMASSIKRIFPEARHRLCTWHIGENAKQHIKGLLMKEGFAKLFDYCLKYIDTVAEFEHYWNSLKTKYECEDNKWLKRLEGLKELWCPAYSKDKFSGGVLSSQRSESTNNSLARKIHATYNLCDVYKIFMQVVEDWRISEKGGDYYSGIGNRYLAFENIPILVHAREVYTGKMSLQFKQRYTKGMACATRMVEKEGSIRRYLVGRTKVDFLFHTVCYSEDDDSVDCTCQSYTESGILCCHCLRVFVQENVERIPQQYIMKRWTKQAMNTDADKFVDKLPQVPVPASVWRVQFIRKFVNIIYASQHNLEARAVIECTFTKIHGEVADIVGEGNGKDEVEDVVEKANILDPDVPNPIQNENEVVGNPKIPTNVKNPPRKTKISKNQRNLRPQSTEKKARNKVRGWNKRREKYVDTMRKEARNTVGEYMDVPPGGLVAHTFSSKKGMQVYVPKDYNEDYFEEDYEHEDFVQDDYLHSDDHAQQDYFPDDYFGVYIDPNA